MCSHVSQNVDVFLCLLCMLNKHTTLVTELCECVPHFELYKSVCKSCNNINNITLMGAVLSLN